MIITCLGHAEFLVELACGTRIVIDPFDASCGYPVHRVPANIVLVSHGHHDHCAVENIDGDPCVIDKAGDYDAAPGVHIRAVQAWHDDAEGAKRGPTLMFVIESEGLRVCHVGDLGHMPGAELLEAVGPVDLLMLPVGGFYTIDAKTAAAVAEAMHARVILPMHYRTQYNADWPIAPVDDFLALYRKADCFRQPLLRVTAEDIMCVKPVVVLEAPEAAE